MITHSTPGTRVRFTFKDDSSLTDYGTIQGASDHSPSRVVIQWDSTGKVTHCIRDLLTEVDDDE